MAADREKPWEMPDPSKPRPLLPWDNPDKEGPLVKQGHFVKNWKMRYFRLKTDSKNLYYFAKQNDVKPKGTIHLNPCTVEDTCDVKSRPNCFSVTTFLKHRSGKKFIIQAASKSESAEWVRAIKRASVLNPLPSDVPLIVMAGGRVTKPDRKPVEINNVDVFDTIKNQWTSLPQLVTERCLASTCVIGHRIFSLGGLVDGAPVNSCDVFDTWTHETPYVPDMEHPRAFHASLVDGDRIFVFGGLGDKSLCQKSAEVLNTTTGIWDSIAPMSIERAAPTACTLGGNRIFLIGGSTDNSKTAQAQSTAEVYDILGNKWAMLPNMTTPRGGHTACVVEDKIYVIGGGSDPTTPLDSCEMFDTSTLTWSAIPSLSAKRMGIVSCTAGQRVFAVGGAESACLEAFDTRTNEWTLLPPMSSKRIGHSVCLVADRIYVSGGLNETGATLNNCEYFDIKKNEWATLPPMPCERSYAGCGVVHPV